MTFEDFFRISAHAVITNSENKILLLKATYDKFFWVFPGGSLDPGETVHEALHRECYEELGFPVKSLYLSGIYFHERYNSQSVIFRCEMPQNAKVKLSHEHSEFRFFKLEELSRSNYKRAMDCLNFDGEVKSEKFLNDAI